MNNPPVHLRIASLNVNGLRNARKRNDLIRWLRRERVDLAALQDVRFNPANDEVAQWSAYPGVRSVWAEHTAFLVLHPSIHIESQQILDPRLSKITLSINDFSFTMASVYAPPDQTERGAFFHNTLSTLPRLPRIIMAGDFNTYGSGELDRYPPRAVQKGWQALAIELERLGLTDTYRYAQPEGKQFTFTSASAGSHSRLDYFFTTTTLLPNLVCPSTLPCPYSDHTLLLTSLRISTPTDHGPGQWRLDTRLLTDEIFQIRVRAILKHFQQNPSRAVYAWDEAKAAVAAEARRRKRDIRDDWSW
jgi:exonuclease III